VEIAYRETLFRKLPGNQYLIWAAVDPQGQVVAEASLLLGETLPDPYNSSEKDCIVYNV